MNPNAGDVQAPAPSATPGAGKKVHVYREEWEMDEGAYGSMGTPRVKPYSMCSLAHLRLKFYFICLLFFNCLGLFLKPVGRQTAFAFFLT